ncbi:hypothetical protein AMS68_003508 [Peltaster fructicola]|uniref:F-box domain-containing protein n=1 Tax=Peltaster fructicola TaxID=286661 RepID=A0A6H0XTJ9_9PEZI|nr:hypothetical protein AMS68_003508 [Peltaster fructicola]
MSRAQQHTRLLELPAELVHHILTYLPPIDLPRVAASCKALHALSIDDRLWQACINDGLPQRILTPAPLATFRDLYIAHHPYWFLPRNQLWFADNGPNGRLILARYDPRRGSIVAHTITAWRGAHTLEFWDRDREVIIHSFNPQVSLDLVYPVLCLDSEKTPTNQYPSARGYASPTRYSEEVLMPALSNVGLCVSLMLCRSLRESAITQQTQIWPPLRFPSASRTRNDSQDNFNSLGHRPTRFGEVSQETFRLHKWVVYNGRGSIPSTIASLASSLSTFGGLAGSLGFTGPFPGFTDDNHRFPESMTTYATLPRSCYTPTKQKPWQGIWCGDYSGHGSEFLVITQPDKEDERALPEGMGWLRPWLRAGRSGSAVNAPSFAASFEMPDDAVPDEESNRQAEHTTDYEDVPSGRLEAIKLTGDPNIPRGEFTFIAPDIGHEGFVRVADEEAFRGARIVRSAGHIAGRGFQEAQYTPSQLIMVSHDRLAQFWEGFGHISFYQRVDIEALMKL